LSTLAAALPAVEQLQALDRWSSLVNYLQERFHKPDIEALEVALSVAISHYFKQEEPVWLMVLGPPGTGKTSVIMGALGCLQETYQLDDLTPTTLLSGWSEGKDKQGKRKRDCSLLNNIGIEGARDGILLMPDFTCFMAKRIEERQAIAGQLRRVYDGEYDRFTGMGDRLEWKGKVTMMVCGTPAVESAWALMRDLGERFMQVRWDRGDGVSQARAAAKQIGSERQIKAEIRRMTTGFVDWQTLVPVLTPPSDIEDSVVYLAEIVARCRGHVKRETGSKEILEVPEPEGPTRAMKALAQIARAHATLFRKTDVDRDDFRVSKRLAMDSLPPTRRKILETIANYPDGQVGWANLVRLTGVPPTTLTRNAEDLSALGILTIDSKDRIEKIYEFSEEFKEIWEKAIPILRL
jgi:DNA-binding MarR family transcriptional regulator